MSHIHLLIFDYLLLVNLDECQTPTQYELSKKCAKLNQVQILSQRLGKFRLTYTGSTEEDNSNQTQVHFI